MLHECMKMLFYDCKPDESDRADWSISIAAGGSPADFFSPIKLFVESRKMLLIFEELNH